MATQLYTHWAAGSARRFNAPWRIRLEYRGHNEKNLSGHSDKFWEAESNGDTGMVKITWGKRGTLGTTIYKNWSYFGDKLPEKLKKGYQYARGSLDTFERPAAPAPKPAPVAKALPTLAGPYALVRWLKDQGNGAWLALDEGGNPLLDLPADSAQALMSYPQINLWP